MNPQDLMAEIGGVPFVDDATFKPKSLLTAVAIVRRSADPKAYPGLGEYLDPEKAERVFARSAASKPEHIEWTDLSADETDAVDRASAQVVQTTPAWEALLRMPKRYRRMPSSISSTSVLIPQTIYLGPRAFRDDETLVETLIHEHAHVWLHFIAEIYDLQSAEAPHDYVLPSGTPNKSYRGVLLAAHFAAAAASALGRRDDATAATEERARFLTGYLGGCLDALNERPYGTPIGDLVQQSLTRRFEELARPAVATTGMSR
ncbi:HEXXH motif-containing putative peptide modification protein [Streptomyces luteogriseus]|uniref:aKG-HExxH-type peptide beta-hydroxylase n=1 Tax=Streptomyces luteogriseus TaxID=68233 RepID=UPI0033E4FEC9